MECTAERSPDGQTFTIRRGDWENTYPWSDLARWIAFYERQRANFPKAKGSYDATIAALRSLEGAC